MKTVTFTFDDKLESHHSFVRPLFKNHGITATFFVCNKNGLWERSPKPGHDHLLEKSMTWDQVIDLNNDGFEIGNHTYNHRTWLHAKPNVMISEIKQLNNKLESLGIPKTTTFCYPGYHLPQNKNEITKIPTILRLAGIKLARIGYRGNKYNTTPDQRQEISYYDQNNPYFVECTGIINDNYTDENFKRDVETIPDNWYGVFGSHGFANKDRQRSLKRIAEYIDKNSIKTINFRDLP